MNRLQRSLMSAALAYFLRELLLDGATYSQAGKAVEMLIGLQLLPKKGTVQARLSCMIVRQTSDRRFEIAELWLDVSFGLFGLW